MIHISMKRLFIILFAAMMAAGAMAEGHLKFKGVEINGSIDQFTSQLSKRGCKVGENFVGVDMIKTDFAGVAMLVHPLTTSQTKIVYAVVASTWYIDDQASYMAQYKSLKQLMTEKYGEGVDITLDDGYYANSIGNFERGNASNSISFTSPEGLIILYLHKDSYRANVVVEYIDNTNNSLRKKEANDDI